MMGALQPTMRVILCLTVLFLSNASHLAASSHGVVEADERMVETCRFLGTLTEKALIGTVKKARKKVMKEAAKRGATHVVFTESESANAINFASATGRAYDCTGKPPEG